MGFWGRWLGRAYDAVVDNGRRHAKAIDTRAEDRLLLPLERDKLVSNARSLRRNMAIAAWAIRKHLDYVSTFSFQCRSGNAELDQRVEDLMDWWSRPFNCDVSGRFGLQRLIRMLEGLATTEGDAFLLKLEDGRVQIIEGDRVRTPGSPGVFDSALITDFVHGVKVDPTGHPIQYAICDRSAVNNLYTLREVIDAGHVYQHAYIDRFDQIRGVSPLSSAMNDFFDIHESREYALAKMKLSQLFALKIKHGTASDDDATEPYRFDFGGPQVMELDPEDDASFLESATPSTEFQTFLKTGISIALKSLDIPYSFYDESAANYNGSRQAWLMYQQSAESKRANLIQLLNNLTVWRLSLFIADGELDLPAGMTMDAVKFEWIPTAVPWLDPLKEVTADIMAVKGGFKSRQMICRENGDDFYTVAKQIADENAYLNKMGLGTDVDNVTVPLGELLNVNDQQAA